MGARADPAGHGATWPSDRKSGPFFPGSDSGWPIVSGSDMPPAALAPRSPEESWKADGR
jgi:hypothetical protein